MMVSSALVALFTVLILIKCIHCLEYGTCDTPFIIFKHTVATSNSQRECENAYNIFPDIHDEGADKFHDGQCAHQCKLELPYTCFRIHAPQTYQYDEGLLYIDTFEKKMSEKWEYALRNDHPLDYDAFFDFNMGFWVRSLDEYILHWNSDPDIKLEYFGMEWYYYDANIRDNNYKNSKFYSILVHSPSSAINFEFISYTKPSLDLYINIKWIASNVPRSTFRVMNDPYPWDRDDDASIVPVRISHATTDINKLHDFYVNVLEGNLLYYAKSVDDNTEIVFMHLLGTHLEIQFIQRPISETFGSFTLDKYEDLLMETHESVITSPYCGQDRWMDNHFAYSTWTIPGLMDKIYFNLNRFNIKYKVGKNTYEHASTHTEYQLDLVGYNGEYTFGLWVIEPGGQSIKIGGIVSDPTVAYFAPLGDPQWCEKECNFGLVQGKVDPSHIYMDDLRSSQHEEGVSILTNEILFLDWHGKQYVICIVIVLGMILLYGIVYCCVHCNKITHSYNDYVSI